ncbi:MAG: hypothetical protein M3P39_04305 [Actinomycetota bacterium]|jgi:hypothetical protein|nr:hypothetical protein [Actinomycetota bacterium]
MYDELPPERGAQLRRLNEERLAQLEAAGAERRARLARLRDVGEGGPPSPRTDP